MKTRKRRYLVTPSGFDDIGAVLSEMGEGFEHDEVDWDDLEEPDCFEGCEVLFINCAAESGDEDYADRIAPGIRKFVERGGSLYCSDWACAVVRAAFPDAIEFDQEGSDCKLACQVVDSGLREIIGANIKIHFDLPGWWRIIRTRDGARVFVMGPGEMPVAVGFVRGRGHVTCTSFHNEAQLSEKEKLLLRYLALRPVMARAADDAAQLAKAAQCTPGREIIATINRGQRSNPYCYDATGAEDLLYVLSWTGQGQLRLVVTDPSGKVRHDGEASSTTKCEFKGMPGRWVCTVEAASLSMI